MDINTDYWYKNRWQFKEVPNLSAVVDITANDENTQEDIQEALASLQSQQAQASQQAQQQEGQETPPWADLMQELNLSPQGSKEADMMAIAQAISTKASEATTEAQKTAVQSLVSEFATYNNTGFSVSLGNMDNQIASNANTDTGEFKGRNQLADLNKFFLVQKFAQG